MSEAVRNPNIQDRQIYLAFGAEHSEVIIECRDELTHTQTIEGRGRLATQIASSVFTLLEREGIETHFIEQVSPKRFRAKKAEDIPFEVIVVNSAYGTFHEHNPAYQRGADLGRTAVEFFAKDKHSGSPYTLFDDVAGQIRFYEPHKPVGHESLIRKENGDESKFWLSRELRGRISESAGRIFDLLEVAWAGKDYMLVDLMLEFGKTQDGEIILGGVIGSRTWTLWRYWSEEQVASQREYPEDIPPEEIRKSYEEVLKVAAKF